VQVGYWELLEDFLGKGLQLERSKHTSVNLSGPKEGRTDQLFNELSRKPPLTRQKRINKRTGVRVPARRKYCEGTATPRKERFTPHSYGKADAKKHEVKQDRGKKKKKKGQEGPFSKGREGFRASTKE